MTLKSFFLGTDKEGGASPLSVSPTKIGSVQAIVCRGSSETHRDFCHDFLIHHETDRFFVGAVMDGCSDGVHTQFASSFFGKVFNLLLRTNKMLDRFDADSEPCDVAAEIMHWFCHAIVFHRDLLKMANNELWCTVLLSVYSKSKDKLFIVAFGDGYIHVDGVGTIIRNTRYSDTMENGVLKKGKDKPNYLITDIDRVTQKPQVPYPDDIRDTDGAQRVRDERAQLRGVFDEWFLSQPSFEYHDVNDFSITTDGILTFRSGIIDVTDRVIDLLLENKDPLYGGTSPITLRKKMNIISFKRRDASDTHPHKMHAANQDDVSIIRVTIDK